MTQCDDVKILAEYSPVWLPECMATPKSRLNYEDIIPTVRNNLVILIVCTFIIQVEPCVVNLMGSPFEPFRHAPAFSDQFSAGRAGA